MDTQDLMDRGYEKVIANEAMVFWPSQSLISFLMQEPVQKYFSDYAFKRLKILELGCGLGSVFEFIPELKKKDFHITAIDISKCAINYCQENYIGPIVYEVQDARSLKLDHNVDIIVDAHCLHTITSDIDRKKYYQNIYRSLNTEGLFILESMVAHDNCIFDSDISFDAKNSSLVRNGIEFRKLLMAWQLEKELQEAGFKIIYFRVCEDLKIIPSDSRKNAHINDPELLRALCIKV